MRRLGVVSVAALVALGCGMLGCCMLGCKGQLVSVGPEGPRLMDGTVPGFDAGPVALRDAGPPRDAGPRPDAGPAPDAGPTPADAGPSEVDAGPPPGPCEGVSCGANERCEASTGDCVCQAGFVREGGTCVAPPPDDPALRTEADVCDAWAEGHVENGGWSGSTSGCDVGTLDADGIDDTVRRVNLFRWLAGQPPVTHDPAAMDDWMECARMMHANNALSHGPPSSWDCYTSGGATAAGRSNIALGYSSAPASIDGYMRDINTMSLGHRRWILGSRLSSVQIGSSGRGHCLGVFNSGGSSPRTWTAYPNQGVAPIELVEDPFRRGEVTWSFQANNFSIPSGVTVEVVRVSDGASLSVETYTTGGGGPPPSVGFTPSGWTPTAGERYRVTIGGLSGGDITYEVHLVSC